MEGAAITVKFNLFVEKSFSSSANLIGELFGSH